MEYANWVFLETDPKVKTFCEQPLKIRHIDGNRICTSTFDMWVQLMDDEEKFQEVKHEHEIDQTSVRRSERSIRQVRIQREWCKANGYNYEVVTDGFLYANPLLLANKKRIISFTQKGEPAKRFLHAVLELLMKHQHRQIQQIANATGQRFQSIMAVASFLSIKGQVEMDLETTTFGPATQISLSEGNQGF